MSLFQNSVLNKYLNGIDSEKAEKAWNTFKTHFHNPEIQENIRNSKEEQYQGEFLIDLFVNVFGYVKNPNPNFNLTTELKNIKGAKKTDGAILQNEKAIAVIELKGTNTVDLAKVETQAFGYKNNQPGCIYVITSNFEKLRFYIDNTVEFEEFNLFQLTKERFNTLYLCLSEKNLLKGIPKQIKDESLTREETITKKLYRDYSQFRNEIFDDIQKQNPAYDKLTLFKKTQKLLDRFLFIFFAEDRLLLPPNSIREIVTQWTDLRDKYDEYQPLYNRFKKYFSYMNTGYEGKKYQIFAYNGGLFSPDEILDHIKISDDLLYKHTVNLSNYDFESEVSVNILGHIFEHSLTEIETIQAELQGEEIDKSKTKRKKDGVFYTPKYITKYIVNNTVGNLCSKKKAEIGIDENEFAKERKGRKQATLKKLIAQLDDYRNWLLKITICDPACGSGAFLNQALEFLIEEHRYIDELKAKLLGGGMVFTEVQNDILENNIFGVDINEESVEIAKLSLWLRTSKKGRKLTSLNNNIKCGNSLITDSKVAGKKAFNWQKEFHDVFTRGGFDIIIGNPPYGAKIDDEEDFYYRENYKVSSYQLDTYPLFTEKSLEISKKDSSISFIIPSAWTSSVYDKEFREYLINETSLREIVIANKKAFSDATVETLILTLDNNNSNNILNIKRWDKNDIEYSLDLSSINSTNDYKISVYSNPNELNVVNKIKSQNKKLDDFAEIVWGVKIYEKGKGFPPQKSEDSKLKVFHNNTKTLDTHYPLIGGKNIKSYILNWDTGYVNYGKWLAAPRSPDWFLTDIKRIVVREVTSKGKIQAAIINEPIVFSNSVDGVRMRNGNQHLIYCILGLLNSKLISFYHSNSSPNSFKDAFPKVLLKDLRELPVPDFSVEFVEEISVEVSDIMDLKNKHHKIETAFLKLIKRRFELKSIPKNLRNWNEINFDVFIKLLNRKNNPLTLSEEIEWETLFENKKHEYNSVKFEIQKIEKSINDSIFKQYLLTESEIGIVEETIT